MTVNYYNLDTKLKLVYEFLWNGAMKMFGVLIVIGQQLQKLSFRVRQVGPGLFLLEKNRDDVVDQGSLFFSLVASDVRLDIINHHEDLPTGPFLDTPLYPDLLFVLRSCLK